MIYAVLERDQVLAEVRAHPRCRDVLDRMRRDVDAQGARPRPRPLDLEGLLARAQ